MKKRVVTVPNHRKGKGKTFTWLNERVGYAGDDCLPWPFCRDRRVGRGRLQHEGRRYWAHRLMCELAHGHAPTPQHHAGHECGKGHEGCVNPRHLAWKTATENQLDRAAHGTVLKSWKHKITPEQAERMRELRPTTKLVHLAEMFGCSIGTIHYYVKYRELRGYRPKRQHRAD